MEAIKLRIKDFVPAGEWSHVRRSALSDGRKVPYHWHDFAEVFWVEAGKGTHLRNQVREGLSPGVVCFIRPEDRHGFDARASDGLWIMNVAFPRAVAGELSQRYGKEFEAWPWGGSAGARREVDAVTGQRLTRDAQELAQHPGSRVRLDRFLMDLLMATRAGAQAKGAPVGPAWLEEARRVFCSPEKFAGGVEGFSVLAGRSPEHVNRTVRSVMGITTTEFINALRLDWAQSQLRMTEASVTTVAMDAGFENVSYFIRIFKGRFGVTPEVYRERNRGPVPLG